MREFYQQCPGLLATGMLILLTTLWVYWGAGEMYYEGWWGAWTNRLPYLVPGVACLAFTGLALSWPCLGGWMMIVAGAGAFSWWMTRQPFDSQRLFMGFMLGGFAVLIGILYLFEARYQQRRQKAGWKIPANWFRRNLCCLVAFALPLGVFVAATIFFAPLVLSRYDEHDQENAWYVPYTGGGTYGGAIDYQPKDWGNPRHGFRCVREPYKITILTGNGPGVRAGVRDFRRRASRFA